MGCLNSKQTNAAFVVPPGEEGTTPTGAPGGSAGLGGGDMSVGGDVGGDGGDIGAGFAGGALSCRRMKQPTASVSAVRSQRFVALCPRPLSQEIAARGFPHPPTNSDRTP